jgi:hypothetical protein
MEANLAGPATPPAHDWKTKGRSRLSNNAEALTGVDMRTVIGRRYKDLVRAIVADQGGIDRLAEVRIQLIRRFAGAGCLAEAAEARMALGQPFDVAEYLQLSSTMARIAQRIGINRTAKDAISLKDYVTTPTKPPPVEIDEEATTPPDRDDWDGLEP